MERPCSSRLHHGQLNLENPDYAQLLRATWSILNKSYNSCSLQWLYIQLLRVISSVYIKLMETSE